MALAELLLALTAACIGFALLARYLKLPYAVILVLGGMLLALLPGLPMVPLDPEFALAFFLPPLLQGSAFRTDWRAFRSYLRPILLLAVGAVAFTAFCIALVARLLLPELPWSAAIALGAIVAPPDAVAAAAVLQRLRLPRKIVTVLEGESLINDASALVLYRLAVAAAMSGANVTPSTGILIFLGLGLGGIVIGWLVAQATIALLRRLGDPMLETATTFLAAYAAYLAAEAAHVSGVMAVVTAGMVFGRVQHTLFSSQSRIAAKAIWDFVEFLLNSLVFVLIGLQLNQVLGRIADIGTGQLASLALILSATLILSRFLWVYPATWLPRLVWGARRHDPLPSGRYTAIVAWAGMRGVVSLAAALALPEEFPERDLIVFLAFCAILATLVVQGTTLEWVIKTLRVEVPAHPGGIDPEEAEARRIIAAAALAEVESRLDDPLEGAIAADLIHEFRDRAGHQERIATNHAAAAAERAARRRIRLAALETSRRILLAHHAEGLLTQEGVAHIEQELDLEELRIRQVLGDERTEAEKARALRMRRPVLALAGHA
ncbi:Na+/H+ antiporter [Siccirubricoccus phaeus]|uniref:Na+/H+ antiporter n=1 Tax=Siccirubricoccus phaeus TaxID=2595053 RepID=UPI00165A5124|nr:Na+/H+ antiporter [Siccirubricoccus phaeus]